MTSPSPSMKLNLVATRPVNEDAVPIQHAAAMAGASLAPACQYPQEMGTETLIRLRAVP